MPGTTREVTDDIDYSDIEEKCVSSVIMELTIVIHRQQIPGSVRGWLRQHFGGGRGSHN
jgi:hypothetical protein